MKTNDINAELVEALKVAIGYMPELQEVTDDAYRENLPQIERDVALVRKALADSNVDLIPSGNN